MSAITILYAIASHAL